MSLWYIKQHKNEKELRKQITYSACLGHDVSMDIYLKTYVAFLSYYQVLVGCCCKGDVIFQHMRDLVEALNYMKYILDHDEYNSQVPLGVYP